MPSTETEKTPGIKADIESAGMGDAAAAGRVGVAATVMEAAADAAEQEAAGGAGKRGLAR